MTDETRNAVFRLKELGWVFKEEISRTCSPIKTHTSGFWMSPSINYEESVLVSYQRSNDAIFVKLVLTKVLKNDEEYDSLFKIITSIKTLDDIKGIVRFWKTTNIH